MSFFKRLKDKFATNKENEEVKILKRRTRSRQIRI